MTDLYGYKKLMQFYNFCREHTNTVIHIDFYALEWIDGNMAALFEAIVYKLNKENGLTFSADHVFIKSRFDVLFRNGFIQPDEPTIDDRATTVPVRGFDCTDKNGFIDYIENDLIVHRGMPKLESSVKEQIINDLIEIFCNANIHAQTQEPFFVAGQYYPKNRQLKFTMVDLGVGFLPKIKEVTKGEVDNDIDAIQWAINGNSTKQFYNKGPGGLGLSSILKYCQSNNGIIDIATGAGYWSSSYENTIFSHGRDIPPPLFTGSTISLIFSQ